EHLLDGEAESPAHARLASLRTMMLFALHGDMAASLVQLERARELARRHDVLDVESLMLAVKGHILARQGRWVEGLAALDEASAIAGGQVDPKITCDVYCQTISACSALGDYRRAAEWIGEADRWMQRRAINGYRGVCRVHRAELKRIGGQWAEAESELRLACEELTHWRLLDGLGMAYYEIGAVRLGLGDLKGAETSFAMAHEYGHSAHPGLSLLLLAQGETEQAARSIAEALAATRRQPGESHDLLSLVRLLPAQVEIALAAGDLETARAAAAELEAIASQYDSDAIKAPALAARGAVELATGAHHQAVATLDAAWRLWQELEAPYESARVRTQLGRARSVTGDALTAALEWRAARAVFERLGAERDLRAVVSLLERSGGTERRRTTKTRSEEHT